MSSAAEERAAAENLTCPVSLELFEDPVQTPCCGNTLSRDSLRKALPRCPLCRVDVGERHPGFRVEEVPANRAIANLVEAHLRQHPTARDPKGSTCAHCHAAGAKFRCSRCKVAHYCSAACQHAAWPEHKGACGKAGPPPPSSRRTAPAPKPRGPKPHYGGGLAAAREIFLAEEQLERAVGAVPLPGSLLAAILDGVKSGTLWAMADPPAFDRLLLASRREGSNLGPYSEHVVEAGIARDEKLHPVDVSDAGGAAEPDAWRCEWILMDYQASDLHAQRLVPIDAPTLQEHYGAVLGCFDASRRQEGKSAPKYLVRADPSVSAEEDTALLVAQLLNDSSLRFVLPPAEVERLNPKRRPTPDPKEVRKALDVLHGISLGRR